MVARLFFYYYIIKEAMAMRECIARLIKCGMPRDVALAICRSYARRRDWYGMEQYVYSVEQETKEREDEEW